MSQTLSGKNILITGGTSRLGQAFVKKALGLGSRVCFTYCHSSADVLILEKLGATAYPLDLSSSSEMDRFIESAGRDGLRFHAVIHNAAAVRDHTIQNLSEEDWDYVIRVNLLAPYSLTRKLLPFLIKEEHGGAKIFFITSRVGAGGGYGVSNYAAAKAGLNALTRSMAEELGEQGVLVNAVNPGFMQSRMTESLPGHVIESNIQASALKKFSDPEEVAEFLAYLCSDQMKQASGQIFHYEARRV